MTKPTKPGWYWVKRTHGADEWVPCCLTTLGNPWIFGDVEEGDDSMVAEWGSPAEMRPDTWADHIRADERERIAGLLEDGMISDLGLYDGPDVAKWLRNGGEP